MKNEIFVSDIHQIKPGDFLFIGKVNEGVLREGMITKIDNEVLEIESMGIKKIRVSEAVVGNEVVFRLKGNKNLFRKLLRKPAIFTDKPKESSEPVENVNMSELIIEDKKPGFFSRIFKR